MTFHSIPRSDFDIVVVGARCAGAGTALNLARGGARVLVIDRDEPGSDTLSTHAIMRVGVTMLDRWGVLPQLIAAGTPAIKRTVFRYDTQSVSVPVRPLGGAAGLYAPRRFLLDRTLAEAAQNAGAEFRYRTSVEDIVMDTSGRVTGVRIRDSKGQVSTIRSRFVVGADGRNSTVARLVQARTYMQSTHVSGAVYGYFDAPASDTFRWVYKPGMSGGIIPTNDGRFCAFGSTAKQHFKSTFGQNPKLTLSEFFSDTDEDAAEAIAQGSTESIRRFPGATGHLKQAFGPGWALVGDAGYFKDPATAHGITDALRDADSLAQAILLGTTDALANYQATRDALSMDLFAITDAIAAHDWTMSDLQKLHFQLKEVFKEEQAFVTQYQRPLAA